MQSYIDIFAYLSGSLLSLFGENNLESLLHNIFTKNLDFNFSTILLEDKRLISYSVYILKIDSYFYFLRVIKQSWSEILLNQFLEKIQNCFKVNIKQAFFSLICVVISCALLVFFGAQAALADAYHTTEFVLPDLRSGPSIIKSDLKGGVWVTLAKAKKLAHLDQNGQLIEEYALPEESFPIGIALAENGNVWYSDALRNVIAEINLPTKQITEYPIPTPSSWPFFLAINKKGEIWYTERSGNKVGKFDPRTKEHTEYSVSTPYSQPAGLTITPQGDVFFTQNSSHKVGHIAPGTENIVEYSVPSTLKKNPYYGLAGITSDHEGNVWFCELDGRLAVLKRQDNSYSNVTEIPLPDPEGRPGGIAVDEASNIWFTELDGNSISRYEPNLRQFFRYPLPTGSADPEPRNPPEVTARGEKPQKELPTAQSTRPFGIDVDRQGVVWFSEQYGNRIGKVTTLEENVLKSNHNIFAVHNYTIEIKPNEATIKEKVIAAGDQIRWTAPSDPEKNTHFTVIEDNGEFLKSCDTEQDCTVQFPREGDYSYKVELSKDKTLTGNVKVQTRLAQTEEILLPPDRVPGVIEADASGNVWFTEIGGFPLPGIGHLPPGNHIGVVKSNGIVKEFETPTKGGAPTSLKISKTGEVWFTQRLANNVTRFEPKTKQFIEYPIPTPNSTPTGIAIDKKRGFIWFTEKSVAKVGYLDPRSGKIQEYDTPAKNSEPSTIALDEQGLVWFDERGADRVVRFDVEKIQFKEFYLPSSGTRVVGISPAKDNVWFLELAASKLGKLNLKTEAIEEYTIPTSGAMPFKLSIDPKGRIWFTEVFGNKVGVFDQQEFYEFKIASENSLAGGITIARDGSVWFTQQGRARLARIPYASII